MTSAIFRHAEPVLRHVAPLLRYAAPLLSIRAPIIAGIATAAFFALSLAMIALFGQSEIQLPTSRGDVEASNDVLAQPQINTGQTQANTIDDIRFIEPEDGTEPSLDGIRDGFTAQTAPATVEIQLPPGALPRAPIIDLTEPGSGGFLPIIGANGLRPSRAYARPFHGDPNTPAIALVIGGMGLNARVTNNAIDNLPPEVALSFAAYTDDLQTWITRARDAGHEVLIEAPMEPFDYPNNDPGPHTLLADGTREENGRRLAWVLSRTTGYFAVTNYLGARFSASQPAMEHLLESLESRGIAFLHDGAGRRSTIISAAQNTDVAYAIADRILDDNPSRNTIDSRLLEMEALAIQNGTALGAGFAYPATVEEIIAWTDGLEFRGYELVPPSAVMARRRLEAIRQAEAEAIERTNNPPPEREPRNQSSESHDEPAASSGH